MLLKAIKTERFLKLNGMELAKTILLLFTTRWIIGNISKCNANTSATRTFGGITSSMSGTKLEKYSDKEYCSAGYIRHENGKCISCPNGFQGKDCLETCHYNLYGYRCLKTCNCMEGQVCDKEQGCKDLKRDITFRTPDYKTFEVYPEFSVTSSELTPEHSTEHKPEGTVNTGNNEETLASRSYQVYLRYVGGGLAVLSLFSIFGTLVIKRSGFNTRARRITLREPVIEEVSLHTIIDVGDSREQEDMYSNVYLEIIDVENGNSNPCNVYEEISGSGSSDSQSNADCYYLDVIAIIEDSPIEKGFSTDDQNTEDKENYDIQFRKEKKGENESDCLTEGF